AKGCEGLAEPEAGLHITGVTHGETLRRPRPDQPPVVKLELRGQRGMVYWLINGRLVAHKPAQQPLIQRLEQAGRVDITVMDEQGRYDRVSVSVK
ncbi:MAG TPA: penicillin-binding protein 1C, partial [Rhodocyclaceae bacterium]|nr:penicillin-binding protein 1C [Rhodocyclaceae bacterium]